MAALALPPALGQPAAAAGPRAACTSRTPSVFGFCVATRPQFYCCSDAETEWSHIYVGQTVDVRGAVPPLSSGGPNAKDVYIVSPAGRRWLLPVDAGGNFSRRITFGEAGTWHLGLDPSGPGSPWRGPDARPLPFQVAYRAVPRPSQTLAALFGPGAASWGDIRVLAAPLGRRVRLRVRFVDARGRPAAGKRLWLDRQAVTTDAEGYAAIPFTGGANYELYAIYPGLFVQTYSRVAVASGGLTGLPRYQTGFGPAKVSVIEVRGRPMVDVAEYLLYGVGDLFAIPQPGVRPLSYDARTGVLRLTSLGQAGLDAKTGLFTWHRPTLSGYRLVSTRLHPVVQGDQVFVSLPDLSRLLSLLPFTWVRPLPDGSILFSTFELP
jgi:hypothetical protein